MIKKFILFVDLLEEPAFYCIQPIFFVFYFESPILFFSIFKKIKAIKFSLNIAFCLPTSSLHSKYQIVTSLHTFYKRETVSQIHEASTRSDLKSGLDMRDNSLIESREFFMRCLNKLSLN